MEQKTEASQAVDERQLFEQNFIDNASDKEGAKLLLSFKHANGEYEAPWLNDRLSGWTIRASLKITPAMTRDLHSLTDEEFSDPVFCRAYIESAAESFNAAMSEIARLKAQPAPTEAQGGKLLELFKLAIGTIAVHDQAEAERIAKMYRSDAVIPASVAAQGEDSARLDAERYAFIRDVLGEYSPQFIDELIAQRKADDAETGGVKP